MTDDRYQVTGYLDNWLHHIIHELYDHLYEEKGDPEIIIAPPFPNGDYTILLDPKWRPDKIDVTVKLTFTRDLEREKKEAVKHLPLTIQEKDNLRKLLTSYKVDPLIEPIFKKLVEKIEK